ncbi:hypothetical protein MTR67_043655 [Solanum verrucosum]|uniref:Integrase zinc-binding domain-containing protein n=1 Tax=Solanum verrucosum TaxID=315347 RepID=A0AAF0ZUX4_SOLVR|nr:hypothetical protein MTR67_043655 [Solanum verrucosum]
MYPDLREVYWWSSMKRCIAKFVANCQNCQQVKEMINMDLITGVSRSRKKHYSIWVIVDQMTKSTHFLSKGLGSNANLSTSFHPKTDCQAEHMIQTLEDMLRACLIYFKEAHNSRYSIHPGSTKMYRDLRDVFWWNGMKRDIADFVAKFSNFQQVKKGLGTQVNLSTTFHPKMDGQVEPTIQTLEDMLRACVTDFKVHRGSYLRSRSSHEGQVSSPLSFLLYSSLRVSPMKGVMRFEKLGKLSPQFIGTYRISQRINNVAYELELPPELAVAHPVFHIFMLKKCMGDPLLIIPTKNIGIKDNLSYGEIPV